MKQTLFATASLLALLLVASMPAMSQGLSSFPGAEGFGMYTTGGRGGNVYYVTNLDPDFQGVVPGSLSYGLRLPGTEPLTILFKVSGIIDGPIYVRRDNVTIAGQSSPGGIILRGLHCGVHYDEGGSCNNLIVRHIRSRVACYRAPVHPWDCNDALRLDGVKNVMIDHVSLAHSEDETVQLSWASNITIQNSILAETIGGHAIFGGILINYANPEYPLDGISIARNHFHRIMGRLPEINCESSAHNDVGPHDISACHDTRMRLEISNNYYFDPGYYITYARWVGDDHTPADGPLQLDLNMVGNLFHVRPIDPRGQYFGMVEIEMLGPDGPPSPNRLYVNDNHIDRYPALADYALFFCCNDFQTTLPNGNTNMGSATQRSERHPFPTVTYRSSNALLPLLATNTGALPHDPMDRRIEAAALAGTIPNVDWEDPVVYDAFDLDFPPASPPAAPLDSDSDGMPDGFELAHGLNPSAAVDRNGTGLSQALLGVPGYTNLEVYLELLARPESPDRVFSNGFEGG